MGMKINNKNTGKLIIEINSGYADLRSADLSFANLSSANLRSADLPKTDIIINEF